MRLSVYECEQILKANKEIFGDSKIYLFGSRTDTEQYGGDIDQYIKPLGKDSLFEKKIRFLNLLQDSIREQKIDLVFESRGETMVELEAQKNGIELHNIKLKKYFNECDKHIQRINEACESLEKFVPISASEYNTLSKEQVGAIDQYMFRFAKLQDMLGDKIFRILISLHVENHLQKSFIDILNILEKIGYIYSAKEWLNLRQIRNSISHQYDDEPENSSKAINEILNCKKIIEKIYGGVKTKHKEVFVEV